MEVTAEAEEQVLANDLMSWSLAQLKKIKPEDVHCSIFAPSQGVIQHTYHYDNGYLAELNIRRSTGIPRLGSKLDLMWLRGVNSEGGAVFIGIDAEYVFERTGMLTSPSIVQAANNSTVPIFDILVAVVFELEPILGIQAESLLSEQEVLECLPEAPIHDYLALDHKRRTKLVFYAEQGVLNAMEANARDYCVAYWQSHDQFAAFIRRPIRLGFFLSKRLWDSEEYAALRQGDLLALQGFRPSPETYRLRGYLCLMNHDVLGYKYEVQFNMTDNSVEVEFTGESINDPQNNTLQLDAPPHEQIELDIIAGQTTIPLGELCAVQAGTLIELGQHNLPMVTLCVNGEAVLHGELVHFKDQIMVQITKRLV
ncbi:FliM/FliN family flagellar motor switch protein [Limnobacter sp.]|uniref:FliM/FliN family flagellar motor switch protein n=1 Tax=Limnobacter sp. TaxID=2003368 RepID=UPI003517A94C